MGLWLISVLLLLLPCNPASADPIEVLWLGHATTRITTATGKVIVIDPFLTTNPKTPPEYRDLRAVGHVDLILVTHGHPDHTWDLVELQKLTNAKVVANYEFGRNLATMGLINEDLVIAMGKGGSVEPLGRGIKISMVPAEHSSSIDFTEFGLRPSGSASMRYGGGGGDPVGYVIQLETGFTIYHTGDTAVFGDMALIQKFYRPDLALVCIGGFYTMDPEQAAYAMTELVKPKMVIPIHWGTYPVINRTPAEFAKALAGSPVQMLELVPGQAWKF
ncbi:MAG: metal-dependent hydrolase [Acetobacteraceae bacterium]|nr:metal-dependent hydrolase [Acetobacteraceae bacterium]